MTAIELKKILVHQIAEINDVAFLNAIKTILDSKASQNRIILTNDQRSDIDTSKEDVEKGLFFKQVELDKEFEKWLTAK